MMFKRLFIVILTEMTLAGCVNDSLSGDTYRASEAKQVQSISYGTVVHVRPIKIQGDDDNNVIGAIGGAVLGGFVGNTIGGGSGRKLATAGGALAGALAGQGVQSAANRDSGVELEIRKDDGNSIVVVQKQSASKFAVGQRVAMASNGRQITVSPR